MYTGLFFNLKSRVSVGTGGGEGRSQPLPPGFEGWGSLVQKLGAYRSLLSVFCFFVYSLLSSTDLPAPWAGALWGPRPPSLCRRPPRARPCTRDREASSAALVRTWCQGVPTDQLDPGLNKDKCVWIRNPRCVLLFPPCSQLRVPQEDLCGSSASAVVTGVCGPLEWAAQGPISGAQGLGLVASVDLGWPRAADRCEGGLGSRARWPLAGCQEKGARTDLGGDWPGLPCPMEVTPGLWP